MPYEYILCLVSYNEFDTSAKKLTTVTHFEHQGYKSYVRYVNFETLISECANVSHIWLPDGARSMVYLSLCLVFYNEFETFVKKLTTVTHLGHPWRGNAVRCVNFETLISQSANVSRIWLPYWVRSRGDHSLCLMFYNDFVTFASQLSILP